MENSAIRCVACDKICDGPLCSTCSDIVKTEVDNFIKERGKNATNCKI